MQFAALNTLSTSLNGPSTEKSQQMASKLSQPTDSTQGSDELKEAFSDFVGQTLFGQMIKSMRSTQQPSAYFNGGRAEEIFQGQLDQVLAEEMSESSADRFADPMYELFMLRRHP
jgi:peptidoglycan hydrolase FlgJ